MQSTDFWYSRIIAATMLFGLSITSPAIAASIAASDKSFFVNPFSEGLAKVCAFGSGWCFYVDKTGKILKPQNGERYLGDFSEGLAAVAVNGKWGFIDKTGKLVIAPQFQRTYFFSEGLARVTVNQGTGWSGGFIDKTGKVVIGPQLPWFWAANKFSEGLAQIGMEGGRGFVDKAGTMVIPPQFKEAQDFSEGLAAVKVNGKWGFIDKTGTMVIEPRFDDVASYYDDATSEELLRGFRGGLAGVEVNDKWGYIDKTGTMVISPQFDGTQSFCEDLAGVVVTDKWGYIDKSGKMVVLPQFKVGSNFSEGCFREGLAGVNVNDKTGYIDKTGKMVISPQFIRAYGFSVGLAAVNVDDKGIWKGGFIDPQGQWVISPEALSKSMEEYVALAEQKEAEQRAQDRAKKQKEITAFRKTLNEGAESNCGPIIEVKNKLVKVAFAVANYGNEHWIRRDEIYPSGYGCRFVNGQYQPPQ